MQSFRKMVAKQLIVAVFLLGVSWAQINRLPPDMAQECIRNGGNVAYNYVERALEHLEPCYRTLADGEMLLANIEEAQRLKGSVNDVFKMYCTGKTQFLGCIKDTTEAFKPCLKASGRARENLDVVRNVVDQLMEVICEQDGARSASLVEQGARECFYQTRRREVLQNCLYSLQPILANSTIFIERGLEINLDASTCKHLSTFQKCVVQDLMKCGQLIGDAAESLLQRLRQSTPCKNFPNSASGLAVTLLTSVMAVTSLLLV